MPYTTSPRKNDQHPPAILDGGHSACDVVEGDLAGPRFLFFCLAPGGGRKRIDECNCLHSTPACDEAIQDT